ncbi:MAG: TlpA disulfide reductase family protein [Pyrinomonadaceae bacterium]
MPTEPHYLKTAKVSLYIWLLTAFLITGLHAQAKNESIKAQVLLPKVTQINEISLKKLLKPNGKPLLINFWATWCEPCREEFPELVKIDNDYKGRINFITISLDDLAEINRDVPKFLAEMKAEMPAYLLKTADENAAIALVTKDWTGGLPFTILLDASGKPSYLRQGKVTMESLEAELAKVLPATTSKN